MNIEAALMLTLSAAVFLFVPGCGGQTPEAGNEAAGRDAEQAQEAPTENSLEDTEEPPVVVLETNRGDIALRLMPDAAPKAVENFTGLVRKGYYDGVIFHRVIKDFMIQGGDPLGTGMGGDSLWGGPFEDEVTADIKFDRPGLLAMANSGPNTNRSQFFITTDETPWLNMRHTIFGEVISGMEVLRDIENTPTDARDRPVEEKKINRAYVRD